MKKILILEDNLYTAEDMIEEIRYALKKGNVNDVDVVALNSIDEINEKLQKINVSELLCLIADLNMNPAGLTEEEKRKTKGAVLTGWVWINCHIRNRSELTDLKVIFYSAFINRLKEDNEFKSMNSNERKNVILISKNEYGMENLCREVIKIVKGSNLI